MTTKRQVDLETYRKAPRRLSDHLFKHLSEGDLQPVLKAVVADPRLRLDIRERRFNVYYGGGSLMLADGRKSPTQLHFDAKYYKGNDTLMPLLPSVLNSLSDAQAWVGSFEELISGMDTWWKTHAKGERAHCQAMAAANDGASAPPLGDFLILDMEYQWAQRRLDLIAAEKHPTESDPTGWREPDLVFVEVKSDYSACSGASGLSDHASDYRDIITTRSGAAAADIKSEYQRVWSQKRDLGLISPSVPFERFSADTPGLLLVFVDLDPRHRCLEIPMMLVAETARLLEGGRVQMLSLSSPNYIMRSSDCLNVLDEFEGLNLNQ